MKKFNSISLNHVGIDYVLDVYGDKDNCWFKAVDIAEMLGVREDGTADLVRNVDKCDITRDNIPGIRGNHSSTIFVSEEGLYEILMQSRKPIAKQAKSTIKNYLKDLRKYGMTATNDSYDLFIEYLRQTSGETVAQAAKEEHAKRLEAEHKYDLLRRQYDQDGLLNAERFAKTYGEGLEQKHGYLVHVLLVKEGIAFRRGKNGNQWIVKAYQNHFYQKGCSICFDMEGATILLKALERTPIDELKEYAETKYGKQQTQSLLISDDGLGLYC